MKLFHVLAKRPDVPEDWMIFNAPRPLYGTKEWNTGPFLHGVWYAAIAPDEERKDWMVERNVSLDGWLVFYHTAEELAAIAFEYYEKNYPNVEVDPVKWHKELVQKGLDILNENII